MGSELENLRNRVVAFCNTRGYSLAPEEERILLDIVRIKETDGDYYCPCRNRRDPDTVCVCKPVRDGLVDAMGTCFCNLIVSKKA
jgi:ferredoxin-thioredoxin reductase catalytic subunit